AVRIRHRLPEFFITRFARSVPQPAWQLFQIVDPRHGRAAPDLPGRSQPVALADAAPADAPIVRLVALAAGEQRRSAIGTKVLDPGAAVIADLGIGSGRLAGHRDLPTRADHGHPI